MKATILMITLLISIQFTGQNNGGRIIFSSSEISNSKETVDDFNVKRIRGAVFSDSVVVKANNGVKYKYGPGQIWGFQSKENILFRYYHGYFYRVLKIDSFILYSIKHYKSGTHYYFSQTPDSQIFNMTCKNIEKEFSCNSCFLNKIKSNFKWYEDYSSKNKSTKNYKLFDLYNDCLQKDTN